MFTWFLSWLSFLVPVFNTEVVLTPWQVPQGINRTSLFVVSVSPEAADIPPLDVNY